MSTHCKEGYGVPRIAWYPTHASHAIQPGQSALRLLALLGAETGSTGSAVHDNAASYQRNSQVLQFSYAGRFCKNDLREVDQMDERMHFE